MTLARGSIRGYDDDRMVLLFSMMDGTREVPCAVSGSAMDDLEHVPDERPQISVRSSSRDCETVSKRVRPAKSSPGVRRKSAVHHRAQHRPSRQTSRGEHESSDERGGRGLTVTTYNYGVETVRGIHPTPGVKVARMAAFFTAAHQARRAYQPAGGRVARPRA